VADAADGLPAHLTLLYPFVGPERFDGRLRAALATLASATPAVDYRLVGAARWPDTVYVAIEPVDPFVALQAELQAAFPEFPIYGRPIGFGFVPHVTVAEGEAIDDAAIRAERAWSALPQTRRAAAIEVIALPPAGRWRPVWRIPLGGPAGAPLGKMRP
jgi:2'-5' RNA ligase